MKKHEIDWTNVPINTKLQIKGTGDPRWKNRYFAFCKDQGWRSICFLRRNR